MSSGGGVAGRRGVRVEALGGRASVYSGQRILCEVERGRDGSGERLRGLHTRTLG